MPRCSARASDRRIDRSATRPVQPVWCEAPSPAPSSPWKYSWKSSASRQAGSVRKRSWPPNTGRRPSLAREEDRDQPLGEVVGDLRAA